MDKTLSVARKQNHDDDASRRKRAKTRGNSGVSPWSCLNNDVLFLVIMKLGVIDFVSFSGVCKSWRSLALSNRHRFMTRNQNNDASTTKRIKSGVVPWTDDVLSLVMMHLRVFDFYSFVGVCKSWRSRALANRKRFVASRPPMSMWISSASMKTFYCNLEDFEGRKSRMHLHHPGSMTFVGLTCGYLIFFRNTTLDFWLVNLVSRHQLHFFLFPCLANVDQIKAVLVFSPSIPGSVLVVISRFKDKIWFCTAGKRAWNQVVSDSPIHDLIAFKGKIYTIHKGLLLCELRLDSKPKLTTILKTMNFSNPYLFIPEFVSSGENLYVIDRVVSEPYNIFELDFDKMKWVLLDEKTTAEYAFFFSVLEHGVAIKPESWAASLSQHKRYDCFYKTADKCPKGRFFSSSGWYFPHLSLGVDILHE